MTLTLPHSSAVSLADTLSVVDAVLAALDRRLPVHVSRDDLASAGKLALIEALLRFDGPPEQARAYCYVRVRGAVLDELRRLDPLSRYTRAQVTLVRSAAACRGPCAGGQHGRGAAHHRASRFAAGRPPSPA